MLNWFLRSLGGNLSLIFRSFLPQRDSFVPLRPRRILVLLAFMPAFLLMQLVHWIGFLLDEIFYPGYRRVEVKAPLFVRGVPRSGTTLLHRTLAEDEQLTTFQTWECLFALSVTARKFWLAIGAFACGWRSKSAHIWRTVFWGVAIFWRFATAKPKLRGKLMAALK